MPKVLTRSKLFIKTFLLYIAILIVPVYVLAGISFYFDIKEIKTTAINKSNEEAQNLIYLIDDQLVKIQTLSNKINMLSWVWKLTVETDTFENDFDQIRKKQIIDDLRIFIDDDGLISNMIILFPKKDYAISLHGWFNIDSYINFLEVDKKIFNIIDLNENYNFSLLNLEGLTVNNQKAIWLIHSIDNISEPRAQVIFSIYQDKLEKFIKSISPQNLKSITTYSKDGKPVLNLEGSRNEANENLMQINLPSNVFGWKYEMIFDTSYREIRQNELLTFILILLGTLILSPFAAFALAYLSYSPLKKMMDRIIPDGSIAASGTERLNEYNILENVFRQLKNDNKQMERKVREYSKYAQKDMLVRLLKGYFYNYEHMELPYYGIEYTEENYFAVIIANVVEKGLQKGDQLKKAMMAGMLIEKILENEKIDYKIIDILEEDIVVIISDCNGELDNTLINHLSGKMQNVLKDIEGTDTKISCGKIEKGILGISKSYHNAKESITMSSYAQDMYGSIDITKTLYYPTDWEIQLINNLKTGKEEAVFNILDEIRLENDNRMLTYDTRELLYKFIKSTIARVSVELNMDLPEKEVENVLKNYVKNADVRNRSLTKEWEYIYGICHMICMRTRQTQENNIIASMIMDYINKNYTKSSLSLKEIAYNLGISQSTASKAFKDTYGIKFYDYTCRIRLERAKELLNNNGMTVKLICKEVGYENEFSLRRAFLRYEGISISEYLNSRRANKELLKA